MALAQGNMLADDGCIEGRMFVQEPRVKEMQMGNQDIV
jgi:hypothetical protein